MGIFLSLVYQRRIFTIVGLVLIGLAGLVRGLPRPLGLSLFVIGLLVALAQVPISVRGHRRETRAQLRPSVRDIESPGGERGR
jgi:hypothetical protein